MSQTICQAVPWHVLVRRITVPVVLPSTKGVYLHMPTWGWDVFFTPKPLNKNPWAFLAGKKNLRAFHGPKESPRAYVAVQNRFQ
jgi:hypothetical protein